MVSDAQIEELCNRLQTVGSAVMPDGQGKNLAFVASSVLDLPVAKPTILVAWEGKGAFFWELGTSMNAFLLTASGFSLRVSPTLADILVRVGSCLEKRGQDGGGRAKPLLNGPQGHGETSAMDSEEE